MAKNICEEQTFQQLFQSLSERLRNYLYYRSGDRAQAEDITQEAFLRLWQNCGQVTPEKARPYLFRIANNLFLDQIKHRQVVLAFRQKTTEPPAVDLPDQLVEAEAFREALIRAIQALPEKQRVVFLMSRTDGLTYQEIAELLGISKKAVEKRMSQALIALRQAIDEK